MNGPALTARAKTLIAANSEMAALIRAFDWARTPLGPIEGWSETAACHREPHVAFPLSYDPFRGGRRWCFCTTMRPFLH